MLKNVLIGVLLIMCGWLYYIASHEHFALDAYKQYYDAAEKVIDEAVECTDDGPFLDGWAGEEYSEARQALLQWKEWGCN